MAEVFQNEAFPSGYWASGGIDDLGIYGGGSAGSGTVLLTGVLNRVGSTAIAVINGQTLTLRAYSDIPDGVLFTTPDYATFYAFLNVPFSAAQGYAISYTIAGQSELACFLVGTRLATPRGDVPVERLRPGACVRTVLRGTASVRWVGRRRIAPTGPRTWPVRIAAHAVAPGQPRRDLFLSPDHAVFLDGALIPAGDLVNGTTIARHPLARAEYWHIELTTHDLLLAEGLATESYLDTGNRAAFAGRGERGRVRSWRRDACADLLLDRVAQARARARLIARAGALGFRRTDDPGLVLATGPDAEHPLTGGGPWQATLPPGTRAIRLRSRSAVPAEILPAGSDPRRLGLCVTHLTLDGAAIPPGDPRRAAGWHPPEPGLQWTDGDALLLCDTADRPRRLEIGAAPLLRYWCARAAAAA